MAETTLYVVAVCALVVRDGRVLAMRRAASRSAGPGLWETLSGRVERAEDPLAAARREIAEECGLTVDVDARPVTAYQATRLDRPMVVIVYRADHRAGEVVMSDEHDAYAWLTPDEFAVRSTLTELVAAVRLALASPAGG